MRNQLRGKIITKNEYRIPDASRAGYEEKTDILWRKNQMEKKHFPVWLGTLVFLAGFLLSGVIIAGLIILETGKVEKITINPSITEPVEFQITGTEIQNGRLYIHGWRYLTDNDDRAFDTCVVLYDGKDYYRIPTNPADGDISFISGDPNSKGAFLAVADCKKLPAASCRIYLIIEPYEYSTRKHPYDTYSVVDTGTEVTPR